MLNEIKYNFKEGIRCYYDEVSGKFTHDAETSVPKGFSLLEWWMKDLKSADDSVEKHNVDLVADLDALAINMNENAFVVLKCVDCGTLYVVSQRDLDWYKDRKLDIPKRCDKCRASRKLNKGKDKAKEEPKDIAYRATCKVCGKEFYLTKQNYDWFIEKGYELPKKCFACRKANKKQEKVS